MTVAQLKDALALTEFFLPEPDRDVEGGYAGDLLSWVMGRAAPGCAWMTVMSNANVCAVAVMADISCVILTEGVTPDEDLLARCKTQGVNLLGTGSNTFEIAARLKQLL